MRSPGSIHATLVRVNRVTGEPEPWLAERWTTSPDGRTITLTLREGVTFSDGAPFTSADVVFTFQALYDPAVGSSLASGVAVQRKPLQVTAPDPRTVVVTLPAPFAPGVALLDNVPILPKHLLQAALDAHTFGTAWGVTTAPASMAGLGPFVIADYTRRPAHDLRAQPALLAQGRDGDAAAVSRSDRDGVRHRPGCGDAAPAGR